MGDALGSLSAIVLEPGSWRAESSNEGSGAFVTLGDRGFNVIQVIQGQVIYFHQ
jgi:hypothetical protein